MKDKKEDKPIQSLRSHIISFIFQSICSLAIPIALSFYFAPEKSFAYFQDTVKDKVDTVTSIQWEQVYDLGANILSEVPPMLQTELEVLALVVENVPPALNTAASHLIFFELHITLSILVAIAIAGYFFPFQECKDWLINVLWGSVCIVSGFLPLDSGMEVLADKEAGVYRVAVMLCAVIVTLAVNYIVIAGTWYLVGRLFSILWNNLTRKFKKQEVKKEWKKSSNGIEYNGNGEIKNEERPAVTEASGADNLDNATIVIG